MKLTSMIAAALIAGLVAAQRGQPPQPAPDDPLASLVHSYQGSASGNGRGAAETALNADPSLAAMSRERFHDLEEAMRRGRASYPPPPARVAGGQGPPENLAGKFAVAELTVDVPAGPPVPVFVQLPSRYDARTDWPLMFAMHGGPPGSAAQARSGADRMLRVWADAAEEAGWIVAAPALTPSVVAGTRTEQRLPYELFHPEQARAVIDALRARYRINPDRMVSTGISLGSNYSIAFATAHPDWFSAIVPVSTEGDSRELLLRNLRNVPIYILEGSQDKNIRTITGPRALRDILASFNYDVTYREFGDRAHEGFQEHYGDVLRWLETRPRQNYPREVLRDRPARPLIEPDTSPGVVHAIVSAAAHRHPARWARTRGLPRSTARPRSSCRDSRQRVSASRQCRARP